MRPQPESDEIQEIKVVYTPTDFDLIEFEITAGTQTFSDRFSAVYDPLPSFKKWLEAIAIGVARCSFSFDNEGQEYEFEFEKKYRQAVFRIYDAYCESDEIALFCASVDHRALVEALYIPFLELHGDRRIKEYWEGLRYWELICPALGLDFDETVEFALGLTGSELNEAFFNAAPQYLLTCPDAPEGEGFGQIVSALYGDEEPEYEIVQVPMIGKMPEDYDEWPDRRRRTFIIDWLNNPFSFEGGTKIRDVRSPIIEQFLGRFESIAIDIPVG